MSSPAFRAHGFAPAWGAIAAALALAACSQGDAPQKARANAPLQVPQPQAGGKDLPGDPNEALKERLARQEAASKLFDKARPEQPAAARTEGTQALAMPKEGRSAPAAPSAPVEAPKAAEAQAAKAIAPPPPQQGAQAAAVPVATKSQPQPPAPKKVEAPAPRTDLAAAAPSAAAIKTRLVSRVDPQFPREAADAGVESGNVKARMTLDANGNVTRVEVVEAQPRRFFDRAVVRALSNWKFNGGLSGRSVETEVEFRLK